MAFFHELADGAVAFWQQGEGREAFRLLLLRSGDVVFGYVNRCAHFGVPLAERLDQLIYTPHQRLTCNVHYAHYDWRDGRCLGGECDGEGLWAVPLIRAGDRVCVGGAVSADDSV